MLNINVTVADRTYPLTIPAEQEEIFRKAATTVEQEISEIESLYATRDKQDAIRMAALQLAIKLLQNDAGYIRHMSNLETALLELDDELNNELMDIKITD